MRSTARIAGNQTTVGRDIQSLNGGGRPLGREERSFFEPRSTKTGYTANVTAFE